MAAGSDSGGSALRRGSAAFGDNSRLPGGQGDSDATAVTKVRNGEGAPCGARV